VVSRFPPQLLFLAIIDVGNASRALFRFGT